MQKHKKKIIIYTKPYLILWQLHLSSISLTCSVHICFVSNVENNIKKIEIRGDPRKQINFQTL